MPGPSEIAAEIAKKDSEQIPPQAAVRWRHLRALARHTGRDTILYAGTIGSRHAESGVFEGDTRGMMEALKGLGGDALDLVLHSHGGGGHVAEQIGNYLRAKYGHIRAIVPQKAMSAATMMACACDEIVMGKHSAIGPIDPQLRMPGWGGHFYPVALQSVLDEFEAAKREVAENPQTAAFWLSRVDHPAGFLTDAQKAIDRAETTVREWLEQRMLEDEPDQAKAVAQWLAKGDHKEHGRPISIDMAGKGGLKIVALENDQKLQDLVLSVFHAAAFAIQESGIVKIIENQHGKGYKIRVQRTRE